MLLVKVFLVVRVLVEAPARLQTQGKLNNKQHTSFGPFRPAKSLWIFDFILVGDNVTMCVFPETRTKLNLLRRDRSFNTNLPILQVPSLVNHAQCLNPCVFSWDGRNLTRRVGDLNFWLLGSFLHSMPGKSPSFRGSGQRAFPQRIVAFHDCWKEGKACSGQQS